MRLVLSTLLALFVLNACSTSNDDTNEDEIVINAENVSLQVDENPSLGTILGAVGGTTNSGTLSYVLVSVDPAGALQINTTTGEISVANISHFEFDVNPTITAIVQLKNSDVTKDITITITLNEVEEEITVSLSDFEVTIDENPDPNQVLGIIDASTNIGEITFSINSVIPEGALQIDSSTGEIIVGNADLFDFEQNPVITAVVSTQNDGVTNTANVTVNLNDIVETPISFTQIMINGTHFSGRTGMRAIEFNNKLLLLGGWNGGNVREVWSTEDGATWELLGNFGVKNSTRETDGNQVRVAEFNSKLWIVTSGAAIPSEVWSSSDGTNWQEETLIGDVFPGRNGHEIFVFQNKLWLIGGQTTDTSGVWSSSDGTNWSEVVTSGTTFGGLQSFQVAVFNDKIYVIGGRRGSLGTNNEVWSSSDGTNWDLETSEKSKFFPRSLHQVVVFGDKMWLIGGIGEEYENDVWSTVDGTNWKKEIVDGNYFSPRAFHASAMFDSSLWVIGGRFESDPRLNDIWRMD
ncbi:kelch repeat-containing protein [Flagellimonas sp. CMM7]|uniref:Kelch repeat-containing protein n=1 Tax=Flagellimonas sp. CMM7 TaxID=2654676 RepID=UPI0013D3584E|nr:kelch repeat-containing protein [Flagellimonas sp. CMM7]UII80559.1 hypothetical protein LV704_03365 [Flagellimonas sp. CMM7]